MKEQKTTMEEKVYILMVSERDQDYDTQDILCVTKDEKKAVADALKYIKEILEDHNESEEDYPVDEDDLYSYNGWTYEDGLNFTQVSIKAMKLE